MMEDEITTTELAVAVTPMSLLQQAIAQKVDVAQLEKLMDMQERFEKRQAYKAFVDALGEFKKNVPLILKNRHVEFGKTSYMHATIDNVCDILNPALAKYDLSFRWETDQKDGIIKVTCILTHGMGHSERTSLQCLPDSSGGKNAIQAVGSTVTYLQRYTVLTACGVAVQGTDDDGRAAENDPCITVKQQEELATGLNATKSDWDKFFSHFRIADLTELKASQFGKAQELIAAKRKAGAK